MALAPALSSVIVETDYPDVLTEEGDGDISLQLGDRGEPHDRPATRDLDRIVTGFRLTCRDQNNFIHVTERPTADVVVARGL